jgi:hypothetical protein
MANPAGAHLPSHSLRFGDTTQWRAVPGRGAYNEDHDRKLCTSQTYCSIGCLKESIWDIEHLKVAETSECFI